jgi:hypothetical protein
MGVTTTAIRKPAAIGAGNKIAHYAIAWDNSYASGGEPIDLTDDFEYIHTILVGGQDTLADGGYKVTPIFAYGTAITSSNVTLALHISAATATVFGEASGNVSAIGETKITVIGR